ncbi:DUF4232 domain-containing protein [Streptomyces formicae]
MRTFRSRTTVLAATATAALALTLTACGGGDEGSDAKSAGSASGGSASSSSTGTDKGTSSGTGTSTSNGTGTGTGKGTSGDDGAAKASAGDAGSKAAPLCTIKDVNISAANRGGPPYTHIVLTAKNTSGHSCTMNGFPQVQFLESHKENVSAVAKSKPAAPVVLPAGAPAYALVKLSDGGKEEATEPVTAFSVMLQGGSGQAAVKAPGGSGIAVDPAKWATGYWTPELRNGADDF